MHPTSTRDANRNYTRPENWDENKAGECGVLSVRTEQHGPYPMHTSTWRPSLAERKALIDGAVIEVHLVGLKHQCPMSVSVVEPSQPASVAVGGYDEHGPATP